MELFDVWFKELRWVQDILHVRWYASGPGKW